MFTLNDTQHRIYKEMISDLTTALKDYEHSGVGIHRDSYTFGVTLASLRQSALTIISEISSQGRTETDFSGLYPPMTGIATHIPDTMIRFMEKLIANTELTEPVYRAIVRTIYPYALDVVRTLDGEIEDISLWQKVQNMEGF